MKGGLKRLSSFGKFNRDKQGSPNVGSPERDSLSASQKLHKSITMTKTILKKKIGSIPDVDGIPKEVEQYKNNLKVLISMFDDYSKISNQMRAAIVLEEQASKQITSALFSFSSKLSKSEASRSLGKLNYKKKFLYNKDTNIPIFI